MVPGHRRVMLAVLADNPEPWRDAPEVGEGGGSTVRFTPWHDSSWPIVAASMSGMASAMADQWRVSARAARAAAPNPGLPTAGRTRLRGRIVGKEVVEDRNLRHLHAGCARCQRSLGVWISAVRIDSSRFQPRAS